MIVALLLRSPFSKKINRVARNLYSVYVPSVVLTLVLFQLVPVVPMEVNDLVDEVLSLVFRHTDWVTLHDVVPLVCKRWNILARQPHAWSGIQMNIHFE